MAVTKKGNGWEFKKSLWIIWSFIFLVDGIGMYLAGKKVKVRKWYSYGLLYTAIAWISMIWGSGVKGGLQDLSYIIFFLSYLACIVHSFRIRKEYLVRLELLEDSKAEQHELEELRSKASKEYGMNSVKKEQQNINDKVNVTETIKSDHVDKVSPVPPVTPKVETMPKTEIREEAVRSEVKLLDINTCSELELSELPGMGLILAKKAVNLRNSKNGFESVGEFIQEVGIKPHFVERLKSMICCTPVKTEETIKTSGRMVDF